MTAAHPPQPHLDHLRAIAAADRATYTPDDQPQAAHGYILVWHGAESWQPVDDG